MYLVFSCFAGTAARGGYIAGTAHAFHVVTAARPAASSARDMEERAIEKQTEADDLKVFCDKLDKESKNEQADPLGILGLDEDDQTEAALDAHDPFFDACMRIVNAGASYMAAPQNDCKF